MTHRGTHTRFPPLIACSADTGHRVHGPAERTGIRKGETLELDITSKSLEVFVRYARDADNWLGLPLVDGSVKERGNLTQLKRAGLIVTFSDGGCVWLSFTKAGRELAAQHGIEISD